MFCRQCGTKLEDDAKFCTECGAVLPNPLSSKTNQSAQPSAPAETPVSPISSEVPAPPISQAPPIAQNPLIAPNPIIQNQPTSQALPFGQIPPPVPAQPLKQTPPMPPIQQRNQTPRAPYQPPYGPIPNAGETTPLSPKDLEMYSQRHDAAIVRPTKAKIRFFVNVLAILICIVSFILMKKAYLKTVSLGDFQPMYAIIIGVFLLISVMLVVFRAYGTTKFIYWLTFLTSVLQLLTSIDSPVREWAVALTLTVPSENTFIYKLIACITVFVMTIIITVMPGKSYFSSDAFNTDRYCPESIKGYFFNGGYIQTAASAILICSYAVYTYLFIDLFLRYFNDNNTIGKIDFISVSAAFILTALFYLLVLIKSTNKGSSNSVLLSIPLILACLLQLWSNGRQLYILISMLIDQRYGFGSQLIAIIHNALLPMIVFLLIAVLTIVVIFKLLSGHRVNKTVFLVGLLYLYLFALNFNTIVGNTIYLGSTTITASTRVDLMSIADIINCTLSSVYFISLSTKLREKSRQIFKSKFI